VELSFFMKLRIAAAMCVGALLIGILCWPNVAPAEPFGIVKAANLDATGVGRLIILALFSGFIAYFLAWPYGKEMAVLAAPTGLAVWSIRSGDLAGLMQPNSTVEARQAIFASLRWESFLWLAIVLAGFAGVYLASKIRERNWFVVDFKKLKQTLANVNVLTAVLASALIVAVIILQLARDVNVYDVQLGSLAGQPAVSQIAFAILIAFGAAGFVVKKFLGLGYFWPILASAIITVFISMLYANHKTVELLTANQPAVFFTNSLVCILPIQMVSYGTLGAIWGYWLAVRYNYWRTHEGQ
jgi:hypothetical protein